MKDFKQLAIDRRSVRQFTDELLTPEEVQSLLEAALLAPSSRNKHNTRLVAIDNRALLDELSQVRGGASKFLATSPFAIALVHSSMLTSAWREDASIVASYLQLQAEDLGLTSCWCQITGRNARDGGDANYYVGQRLNIPNGFEVVCIIAFGHAVEPLPAHDMEALMWERVHLQKFDLSKEDESLEDGVIH